MKVDSFPIEWVIRISYRLTAKDAKDKNFFGMEVDRLNTLF